MSKITKEFKASSPFRSEFQVRFTLLIIFEDNMSSDHYSQWSKNENKKVGIDAKLYPIRGIP